MKKNFNFLVLGLLFLLSIFFTFKVYAQEPPRSYIVVFKDNVANPAAKANAMALQHGLSIAYQYSYALKGFAATIPQSRLNQIAKDSDVKFISEDRTVTYDLKSQGKPYNPPTQPPQTDPTGIRRIGKNSSNFGSGIGVAVIDTGIDLTHPDLQGNIAGNYSCIKNRPTGDDDNGHGSHVAGTIAAINNAIGVVGVAPQAKLYAVKVLNSQGSGTWSSVICGIDWVTAHSSSIKVANMSLGGSGSSDSNCGNTNSDALHQAICKSRDAGVTYVVAAGNENDDVVNHVPAAYNDSVITVSALADSDGLSGGLGDATSYGLDDRFASFSNYNSAIVDLGAPGVNIYSTWKDGTYNTVSGTSMSTPHVSGAAALYIYKHPGSKWTDVRDGLISLGESAGTAHFDDSALHPEKVVLTGSI